MFLKACGYHIGNCNPPDPQTWIGISIKADVRHVVDTVGSTLKHAFMQAIQFRPVCKKHYFAVSVNLWCLCCLQMSLSRVTFSWSWINMGYFVWKELFDYLAHVRIRSAKGANSAWRVLLDGVNWVYLRNSIHHCYDLQRGQTNLEHFTVFN